MPGLPRAPGADHPKSWTDGGRAGAPATKEGELLMARDDDATPATTTRPPAEADSLGGESNPELLPAREPWRSIVHGIGIGEQVVGSLLLLAVFVLVLAQVLQRYVPGTWPWTGEVARLSLVWATFVIAGYLAAFDRHIAIHVVDYVLGGRALASVKLFAHVVVLITCIALGVRDLAAAWPRTSARSPLPHRFRFRS